MFQLLRTKAFDRDVKQYLRKGGDQEKLGEVLMLLRTGEELPVWCRDHQLQGKLRRCRELHVEHDWVLVYQKDGKKLTILCLWLVSHKRLRERERGV